jgi:hypothetical protein
MDPLLKQLLAGQSTALISIVNWLTKQPNASRRMLDGIAVPLTGTPIILKHLGMEDLGEELARTLSEAMDRCRSLHE